MVSIRPPAGSALAIHRVEKPIAVPISSTRVGATAVTSTRSSRPTAGWTIGTPSLRPLLSISSRTGPRGGGTPPRYLGSGPKAGPRRPPPAGGGEGRDPLAPARGGRAPPGRRDPGPGPPVRPRAP